MPRTILDQDPKIPEPSFQQLWQPVEKFRDDIPLLQSRGNRQLKMDFEQQPLEVRGRPGRGAVRSGHHRL